MKNGKKDVFPFLYQLATDCFLKVDKLSITISIKGLAPLALNALICNTQSKKERKWT